MTAAAMAAEVTPFEGVYLKTYLRPFAPWLAQPDVTEIMVNRAGEAWIERSGRSTMQRVEVEAITADLLARLAGQVARATHQGVNRENPLLAATLPGGERIQMVGPPAALGGWALAIRRHLQVDVPLETFHAGPLRSIAADVTLARDPMEDPVAYLREAVTARRTILISGGTSSGKTTFLNGLLKAAPHAERLVTVEDTPEISVSQPNALRLIAVKGDLGEAKVSVDDLLQASLRLRPDRIVVGEIRGREAATFLRAINTGHPGSFTTVHANTPEGALEQIALMVMQAGLSLSRAETIGYVRGLVDVVVQLGRVGGERRIVDLRVHHPSSR